MMQPVDAVASIRFSAVARLLSAEARRRGLRAPGFRSPPGDDHLERAIRRYPGGQSVVAVRMRGRPPGDVLADMVDGVVAANGLCGAAAAELRGQLLAAVEPAAAQAA